LNPDRAQHARCKKRQHALTMFTNKPINILHVVMLCHSGLVSRE